MGGYYAARAGSREHRLAACIARRHLGHRAALRRPRRKPRARRPHEMGDGCKDAMAEAVKIAQPFKLEGVLDDMKCPYLVLHGGHDVLGVETVKQVHRLREGQRHRRHPGAHRGGGHRRRTPPARQPDPGPGDHDRLAGRQIRHRPAQAEIPRGLSGKTWPKIYYATGARISRILGTRAAAFCTAPRVLMRLTKSFAVFRFSWPVPGRGALVPTYYICSGR